MDDTVSGSPARIEVLPDAPALARRASEVVEEILREAIAQRGRALFALAGGSTPRSAYAELTSVELQWAAVEFLWGDERVVPPDHPESNVRMARETLLMPLNVESSHIHVPRTDLGAQEAALAYERTLRELDPRSHPPRLDLALLGIGKDGHTASLFPGGPELDAPASRLVIESVAPFYPPERISLTLRALNAARNVVFLVSGEDKRGILERVLAKDADLPAARVQPMEGSVLWLVDQAAHSGAVS